MIPAHPVEYRGHLFDEMDAEAACSSAIPRSPSSMSWRTRTSLEPVARSDGRTSIDLLHAGIEVITTVNVQHIESLNDVVADVTGIRQRETVPDWVVDMADQVELVDLSPHSLRRRMLHGNVYPDQRKAELALQRFFTTENLTALRELALMRVANQVDETLLSRWSKAQAPETRERVLVCVTPRGPSEDLIRRGARVAQRARGDLLVVHVRERDDEEARAWLSKIDRLVRDLGGELQVVDADDPVEGVLGLRLSAVRDPDRDRGAAPLTLAGADPRIVREPSDPSGHEHRHPRHRASGALNLRRILRASLDSRINTNRSSEPTKPRPRRPTTRGVNRGRRARCARAPQPDSSTARCVSVNGQPIAKTRIVSRTSPIGGSVAPCAERPKDDDRATLRRVITVVITTMERPRRARGSIRARSRAVRRGSPASSPPWRRRSAAAPAGAGCCGRPRSEAPGTRRRRREMSGSRPLADAVTRSTGISAAVRPPVYGPSTFRIRWILDAMSSERGFDVGPRFDPLDVEASSSTAEGRP